MFVGRDPFARTELHKERVYLLHVGKGCEWCGGVCTTAKGRPYLWQFRLEHDGGRVDHITHLFCRVGCMRIYND